MPSIPGFGSFSASDFDAQLKTILQIDQEINKNLRQTQELQSRAQLAALERDLQLRRLGLEMRENEATQRFRQQSLDVQRKQVEGTLDIRNRLADLSRERFEQVEKPAAEAQTEFTRARTQSFKEEAPFRKSLLEEQVNQAKLQVDNLIEDLVQRQELDPLKIQTAKAQLKQLLGQIEKEGAIGPEDVREKFFEEINQIQATIELLEAKAARFGGAATSSKAVDDVVQGVFSLLNPQTDEEREQIETLTRSELTQDPNATATQIASRISNVQTKAAVNQIVNPVKTATEEAVRQDLPKVSAQIKTVSSLAGSDFGIDLEDEDIQAGNLTGSQIQGLALSVKSILDSSKSQREKVVVKELARNILRRALTKDQIRSRIKVGDSGTLLVNDEVLMEAVDKPLMESFLNLKMKRIRENQRATALDLLDLIHALGMDDEVRSLLKASGSR